MADAGFSESLNKWICNNQNTIYRMYEYKKVYTPYEQEHKYMDESMFISNYATFVHITEAIDIHGDLLLRLEELNIDEMTQTGHFLIRRLSDIQLDIYNSDQEK